MGFFLSSIKADLPTLQDHLSAHSYPLQRVREYHGIFKSVCDNFVIKSTQFQQIFGTDENLNSWNAQSVNALQLFCGLAFYAKECTFRSKVRFLFILFDFNEIKSISIVDLEYMILSVCNFTYKVLGKVNTKADELRLAEWLLKYLDPHKRITVTRLYRLCGQAEELADMLEIAGAKKDEFQSVECFSHEPGVSAAEEKPNENGDRDVEIDTKLTWFTSFCSKLAKPKYKKESITNTKLNWVYGIEIDKIAQPLLTLSGPVLLYAISTKMIVFDERTKTQKIYSAHTRQITSFCMKKSQSLVASAEGKQKSWIFIWNYKSIQTIHIIRLDHTDQVKLMRFSQYEPTLAVAAQRKEAPFLLFETITWGLTTSFSHTEQIKHLIPLITNIPRHQLAPSLQGFFVISGPHNLSIIDETGIQYQSHYESEVTSLAVGYMNSMSPYLRYFHGENLRLFVVTGHVSGSVIVWQVSQDSPFEGVERDKYEILRMSESIVQLVLTEQSFFVVTSQDVRVYDLSVLTEKDSKTQPECRNIKLYEHQPLKLINYSIKALSVTETELCVLTIEGDCILVSNRQILCKQTQFIEQESMRRIDAIVKFEKEMRAMCFLEKELNNVLLVVSAGRRILQIDPLSHEVTLILDIGFDDFISVIDSSVSEEGAGLTICGCRSGKLILRNDWEENCKVVDCQAEVCDLKISPEGNTLLVATMNTLLFFHLGASLSSPRKLTFENQSPISLAFLDNSAFCAITTTAKNVYLLQLPSLKHRSVFRDVDTFAASRLGIAFPLPLQKSGIPSQCMVGGDIKFYIISLDEGSILFFPSMSSLEQRNFILLQAHRCPIVSLVVSESETTFYTLGQRDEMLLEWAVQQQKELFQLLHEKQSEKLTNSRIPLLKYDWQNIFTRLKRNSEVTYENQDYSLCTFFFRGTTEKKLNKKNKNELESIEDNLEEVALAKRHSRFALETKMVYGMQVDKNYQVWYRNQNENDSTVVYTASRFLIESSMEGQDISECHANTIGFVAVNSQGEVIWSESGRYPWIWKNGERCIKTKHSQGLIHFTLSQDLILSYGISEKTYTLNLHNYRTKTLLCQRTTDKQILSFLMLSETEFISLAQIRWWKNMVQSSVLGLATSGVILHNGKDVCLGGSSGELSILSQAGLVQVARQAHNKEITVMKTNIRDNNKELVTASQDQTIKIWNQNFEMLLVIDLNFQEQFSLLHEIQNQNAKSPMVCVSSIDCKQNRVVAALAHGQIWEFVISALFERVNEGADLVSEVSLQSESDENQVTRNRLLASDKKHLVYKVQNYKVLDSHCSGMAPHQRYLIFDVHQKYPLLVTAGNDGRLIIRDYERNIILGNYICEDRKQVKTLKFSPQGRMLVVGLTGGIILTFYLLLIFDSRDQISNLSLKYFQTFKPERPPTESISISFNDSGQYFCVSYWQEPKIKSSVELRGGNYLKIYRMKSEKNSNIEEAFYEEREVIELREEEKTNAGLSKCILRMNWEKNQEKQYLIIYGEYLNAGTRYKWTHKGKYEVYCLEEKNYLSDQFAIKWSLNSYPNLIHNIIVNPKGETLNDDYLLTAVCEHEGTLFCGAIDGRLHLVKTEALISEESVKDYKEEEMCLSRTYNSHSTFITKISVIENSSTGKTYVFTSAYGDETLVQFQILEEKAEYFLEHQPYPREVEDNSLHGEVPTKEHFYLMLNNRQPLREELTAVLEDVEKNDSPNIELTPVRMFGRRASDRRYNMAFFQSSALYTLGPNVIIQSLRNPEGQQVMKPDPSPLSHCPQISTFHYAGRFFGVVTEQQHSSLFIWDIKSQSCISSMQLECSVVMMFRFSGDSYAILYGLNDRYELVVQVVNWRTKKQMGRARWVHSGNIAIRDICTYSAKTKGLQFITCGYLHLCYWQLRGDSLVYRSFNSLREAKYLSVRSQKNYIITGCQEGSLYLWIDFQMVHCLNGAHKAAVRCLEVDDSKDLFISGGKDGNVLFVKVQENSLQIVNRVELEQSQVSQTELGEEKSWKVELQVQALAVSSQQSTGDTDRILIGTRSGAIYQLKYSEQGDNNELSLLYEGHDHQTISSATFSTSDLNSFYTLSNAGIIQKWNMTTLNKQFFFELGRKAVKIQSCGIYLLVCCRNEVLTYRVEQQSMYLEEDYCIDTRRESEGGEQSKESQILTMCLSHNKSNIAICLKICTKEPSYQISLFEFTKKEPYHTIQNLKHEIDYIDFSLDDKYFLFKDRYEEIAMINLDTDRDYKRINTIFLEMGLEWQEEGLRISPKGQKIYYCYSCENKITAIMRLAKNHIIVGDQMGTIRIFQYPCPDQKLGELHLQCYTNHMNDIKNIKVHPKWTHVITTALFDRSFILWKVQHPNSHE